LFNLVAEGAYFDIELILRNLVIGAIQKAGRRNCEKNPQVVYAPII
jgi:hypothetical protein